MSEEDLQLQINKLRKQVQRAYRYEVLTTGYDDLMPTPVAAFPGSSAPTVSAYNGGNLSAYEFPNNATKNYHCNWQFPHSWPEGGAIYPHLHLFIPATITGVIKFFMIYTWTNSDEAEPAEATITGTYNKSSGAANSGNTILKLDSAAISPSGRTMSSILQAIITRNPADGDDTFGASVWLKSIDLHYQRDGLGSRAEYTR